METKISGFHCLSCHGDGFLSTSKERVLQGTPCSRTLLVCRPPLNTEGNKFKWVKNYELENFGLNKYNSKWVSTTGYLGIRFYEIIAQLQKKVTCRDIVAKGNFNKMFNDYLLMWQYKNDIFNNVGIIKYISVSLYRMTLIMRYSMISEDVPSKTL